VAQKKAKGKRSIRKQRWAPIVAAIIAAGMLLSSAVVYLGSTWGNPTRPGEDFDLELYREGLENQAENLETFIRQYGPTAAILKNLAGKYQELILLQQWVAALDPTLADPERLAGYQEALVRTYRSLVNIEPDNPVHYFDLIDVFRQVEEDEAAVLEEVAALRELLRQKPDHRYNFYLIGLLEDLEQEGLVQEEVDWLQEYLEQKQAAGALDYEGRYYYARLLGEHRDDAAAALEQLELILSGEPETSEVFKAAQRYRDSLLAPQDDEES
jgi:hypothetical protein